MTLTLTTVGCFHFAISGERYEKTLSFTEFCYLGRLGPQICFTWWGIVDTMANFILPDVIVGCEVALLMIALVTKSQLSCRGFEGFTAPIDNRQ